MLNLQWNSGRRIQHSDNLWNEIETIKIAWHIICKFPFWPRKEDIEWMLRAWIITEYNLDWDNLMDEEEYGDIKITHKNEYNPLIRSYEIKDQEMLNKIILDQKIRNKWSKRIEKGDFPEIYLMNYLFAEKYAEYMWIRLANYNEILEILRNSAQKDIIETLKYIGNFVWWTWTYEIRQEWNLQILISKDREEFDENDTSKKIFQKSITIILNEGVGGKVKESKIRSDMFGSALYILPQWGKELLGSINEQVEELL